MIVMVREMAVSCFCAGWSRCERRADRSTTVPKSNFRRPALHWIVFGGLTRFVMMAGKRTLVVPGRVRQGTGDGPRYRA
jgi:hypothetical protein